MVEAADLAVDFGLQIARRAIRLPDGRCNWMGAGTPSEDGWQTSGVSLGPTVYDGTAGVALFLAALYQRTGQAEFATLACGALATARQHLDAIPESHRCSFYLGWGGVAWAMEQCAGALDDPALTAEGHALMDAAARSGAGQAVPDLLQGSAGAIPAFLDDWARTGNPACLSAAKSHVQRLVETAEWNGETCAWPMDGDHPDVHLSGLSHGAAGPAIALLAFNAACPDEPALRTALGALAHEEAYFSEEQGSWADRRPGHAGYPAVWCHGAGGGALAHAAAAQLLPETYSDVRALCAARAKSAAGRLGRRLADGMASDCLCHGALGNLMCLSRLGIVAPSSTVPDLCARITSQGVRCGLPGGGWTPGLMLGSAGIGLALLSIEDKGFEPPLLPPGIAAQ